MPSVLAEATKLVKPVLSSVEGLAKLVKFVSPGFARPRSSVGWVNFVNFRALDRRSLAVFLLRQIKSMTRRLTGGLDT